MPCCGRQPFLHLSHEIPDRRNISLRPSFGISFPFYDLLQENGHVPEIRKKLPPLLAGVRRSVLEIGADEAGPWQARRCAPPR